jgi:hypothetical protein
MTKQERISHSKIYADAMFIAMSAPDQDAIIYLGPLSTIDDAQTLYEVVCRILTSMDKLEVTETAQALKFGPDWFSGNLFTVTLKNRSRVIIRHDRT